MGVRHPHYADSMTNANLQSPQKSSAWNWPAEWAVERTFWREVGTRTVSGVLTIVILAVPSLIYATFFGLLAPNQVIPILIGIALFAVVLTVYIFLLRMIRRSEIKKIAHALLAENKERTEPLPTPEQLMGFSDAERARIISVYSKNTQDGIGKAEKFALRAAKVATILSAIVSLVAGFIPLIWS